MTIKVICPGCKKIAFTYYIGDNSDKVIWFPEAIACEYCGYKIKKIDPADGVLKRL